MRVARVRIWIDGQLAGDGALTYEQYRDVYERIPGNREWLVVIDPPVGIGSSWSTFWRRKAPDMPHFAGNDIRLAYRVAAEMGVKLPASATAEARQAARMGPAPDMPTRTVRIPGL